MSGLIAHYQAESINAWLLEKTYCDWVLNTTLIDNWTGSYIPKRAERKCLREHKATAFSIVSKNESQVRNSSVGVTQCRRDQHNTSQNVPSYPSRIKIFTIWHSRYQSDKQMMDLQLKDCF